MTATVLPIRFGDPVRLCRFCEAPVPAGRTETCSELCALAVDLYLEEPPEAAELRAARAANVRNIKRG